MTDQLFEDAPVASTMISAKCTAGLPSESVVLSGPRLRLLRRRRRADRLKHFDRVAPAIARKAHQVAEATLRHTVLAAVAA
jgi:hypothetical protein